MFKSLVLILLLQGKRRECLDEPPEAANIFGPEHYGEVGFARDVCVKLGRDLINTLKLSDATKPCQDLALTRTSVCWPGKDCKKWLRNEKNKKVNDKVLSRALRMVEDFNVNFSGYPALTNTEDQKFIWYSTAFAVKKLTQSGAVDAKSKLIDGIKKLRTNYCRGYKPDPQTEAFEEEYEEEESDRNENDGQQINNGIFEKRRKSKITQAEEIEIVEDFANNISWQETEDLTGEGQSSRADYLLESQRREFLQNTENTSKEIKGNVPLEPLQVEDNGEKQNRQKAQILREINIEDPPVPNANTAEEIKKMGNLPLHKSVFQNEFSKMMTILESGYDVTEKDKHGNTALHLAVMLGRKAFVIALVSHGASVRSRNLLGWSAVDEAVSYGDPDTVEVLISALPTQTQDELIKKRRSLLEELENTPDFYMELKWELRTIVPTLSYLMPGDLCLIRKRGRSIRVDWFLIDFKRLRYHYGQEAFLFDGTDSASPLVYYLDVIKKNYADVKIESKFAIAASDLKETARLRMKNETSFVTMSTRNFAYTPVKKWWSQSLKTEKVGDFTASIYAINGLGLKMRRRMEHVLVRKEMKKKVKEQLQKSPSGKAKETKAAENNEGNADKDENKKKVNKKDKKDEQEKVESRDHPGGEPKKRISLPPPPPADVTWEEYINAEPGKYRTLAREIIMKETTYSIHESYVGVVPEFPLSKEAVAKIVEVVAPLKQLSKIIEFMELKLPPGFPVKFDLPLMMGISAGVKILKFKTSDTIAQDPILDENLFKIPEDYKHEKKLGNMLFPETE